MSNKPETVYVVVDSRYRDLSQYPDANHFAFDFDSPFKNVISIELVYALYDKVGNERYIHLCIPEIRTFLLSNDNKTSGVFTQLPLNNATNEYTCNQFRSVKVFNPPLSKLRRLTMSLVSADGKPYPIGDYFARFEIVCSNSQLDVFVP